MHFYLSNCFELKPDGYGSNKNILAAEPQNSKPGQIVSIHSVQNAEKSPIFEHHVQVTSIEAVSTAPKVATTARSGRLRSHTNIPEHLGGTKERVSPLTPHSTLLKLNMDLNRIWTFMIITIKEFFIVAK